MAKAAPLEKGSWSERLEGGKEEGVEKRVTEEENHLQEPHALSEAVSPIRCQVHQ